MLICLNVLGPSRLTSTLHLSGPPDFKYLAHQSFYKCLMVPDSSKAVQYSFPVKVVKGISTWAGCSKAD